MDAVTHQISADCIKVKSGSNKDETMPNCMSKWNDAITLEENNSSSIGDATQCQFVQTRCFFLWKEKNKKQTKTLEF